MKMFNWLNAKVIFLVMLLGPLGWVNVGCGTSSSEALKEVSEVSGTILLPTGRPLKGGNLMLRPFGGVREARRRAADINEDGTFIIRPDVPEKYLDVSEDEFETDLFMNLDEQASSVVLKMTKG